MPRKDRRFTEADLVRIFGNYFDEYQQQSIEACIIYDDCSEIGQTEDLPPDDEEEKDEQKEINLFIIGQLDGIIDKIEKGLPVTLGSRARRALQVLPAAPVILDALDIAAELILQAEISEQDILDFLALPEPTS